MVPASQPQLVDSARHLDWLPGETVYSLASRHHRLSGNLRPDRTARQLFGHARGGYPHDLPAGLDHLAAAFDGQLGDARRIALAHTILPAFLLARPEADWATALSSMRSPRLGSLKAQFGLLASGFGAICELKACRGCIAEDTAQHGTAYWRVEHQMPGVWVCGRHQTWLLFSISNRARQGRFEWSLPEESDLTLPPGLTSHVDEWQLASINRFSRFSQESAAMAEKPAGSCEAFAGALRRGMIRAGWISTSGRLATAAVGKGLKSTITALSALPEWTGDTPSEATCISRVRSVLSEPGQGHPLKLLIVASCLFESWSDFLDETKREETATRRSQLVEEKCFRAQDIRADFLKAAERDASVTELAREFNIAVRTAQGWLAEDGRSTPRRPSKLSGTALLRLTQGLSAGTDPSTLAEETGLSESSVRRVLGTTVGLKSKWLEAKAQALRQQNRARWLAALSVAAPGGPKLARGLDPGAYAWLYRNDREWLAKKNSRLTLPASGNHRALDWDARDRALSKACRLAADELATRNRGARVALVDLVRVVPELRTKICKLDRLPLTRSVIQVAVRADVQQLPLELVDAKAR